MKKIFLLFLYTFFLNLPVFSSEIETLILFDASISMMQSLDGKPKYLWAVDEAKNVLLNISPEKKIGLRTIGVTMDSDLTALSNLFQNPAYFCQSTTLLAPIASNNKNNIRKVLNTITPLGSTPLTYSIDTAINNDFNNNAFKHIILITDGGESCDANPCEYIRNTMKTRNDIRIDIIAIGVNDNDLTDLECLSGRTSGKIFPVNYPNDFKNAFNTLLNAEYNSSYKILSPQKKKTKDSIIYKNYVIESSI